jgi:methyl-accepting chemotaxis protein
MRSIQMKLMITILAIVLVSLSALGGLNYWKARQILSENLVNEITSQARGAAGDVNDWLDTRKIEMAGIALSPVLQTGNVEAIAPFLVNAIKANGRYETFGYITPAGIAHDSKGVTIDLSTRAYFQKAMTGNAVISDPVVSPATGGLVAVVAVPVKTAGKVTGVFFGAMSLDEFAKKVATVKFGQTGAAYVLKGDGVTIANQNKELVMKDNPLKNEKLPASLRAATERMVKGETGTAIYEYNNIEKMVGFAPITTVGWSLAVSLPVAEATGALDALTMISLITIVVVLVIAAIFIAWFARRIAKPIQVLEGAANRIAGGDLTLAQINITSNDEIGRLGQAFETMTKNLRGLIKQVSNATGQLASSSEELTASAQQSADASGSIAGSIQQIAYGSEKQVSAVNDTSAIVEEISATMEEVSATAAEMTTMSEQTATVSLAGKTSVDRAVTQMGAVSVGAKQAQTAAVELKASSAQIGEIVGLISTIAGQTNLLALNAAIEAARAGEQGRGFAVVADEVRKLAEQSETAARQIKTLVGSNHDSIGKVVGAIDIAIQDITQGVELVNVAGANFAAINDQIRQVTDQVGIIAKAISEAAVGSQRIVGSIKEVESASRNAAAEAQSVSAATEEQSASMEEIAASSQSLAKLATDLQVTVAKFRI